ncbi:MAG: serine/threonine protein kinase, partial [Chloroflexi bacterium]
MELLGRTLGQQYQLVELISQSDKNLVYKGFQPTENRYVAVKVLSPAKSFDHVAVQQFQQERQLIAGLSHPNILPVFDYGRQDEILYYVTRFVEGGVTLKDKLPLYHAPHRARPVIHALADALDYVHGQNLLHGNLKPANILIDENGEPLLTDFGAFQHAGAASETSPYQSPEQAQSGPVDARTDVYALGVLLYHMLIGEPPTPGAIPSPRLKRPDLPIGVEKVILKAMAQLP